MGEKKKKPNGGGDKKDHGPAPVVFELDLHCKGCAEKIEKFVCQFADAGVKDAKADISANKLMVTGKVDAAKLLKTLKEETGKKVRIVYPEPKKEKPDVGKQGEDKKPREFPVALKIGLKRAGCIQKIEKIILKSKEVELVTIDVEKDLVTVKGTMEVKELVAYLEKNVEAVQPKKEDDKKENKKEDDKKKKEKEKKKEDCGKKCETYFKKGVK